MIIGELRLYLRHGISKPIGGNSLHYPRFGKL
nr:MAG TPA: hypothetical protein [Caudoviricetes sp.]